MKEKLHLSGVNKMLGGVCGGIAESFNLDPSIVRIAAVLLFVPIPQIIIPAYIIMWIFLPNR